MALMTAVVVSTGTLYALVCWLWPASTLDRGHVDVASIPAREYEEAKRRGCTLTD